MQGPNLQPQDQELHTSPTEPGRCSKITFLERSTERLDTPFIVIQISNGHGGEGLDYPLLSCPYFLILYKGHLGGKKETMTQLQHYLFLAVLLIGPQYILQKMRL